MKAHIAITLFIAHAHMNELKMAQEKKFSSSPHSSDAQQNAKLVLVNREPLYYLEINKPNKQNVSKISSINKFNFSQSQNNCWPTGWFREC